MRRRHVRRTSRRRQTPVHSDLDIKVIPRAGRSGFAGLREGAVLVRLAAAPVDGAANDELIALFAKTLKIPRRDIAIVSGERSRSKRIRVAGLNREQALARLLAC